MTQQQAEQLVRDEIVLSMEVYSTMDEHERRLPAGAIIETDNVLRYQERKEWISRQAQKWKSRLNGHGDTWQDDLVSIYAGVSPDIESGLMQIHESRMACLQSMLVIAKGGGMPQQ